ncbi:MAG: hypothetical protein EBU66_05020 [Bacteroidetes bacterium]|nr:hypothetical protein [bacterium]NBP64024.1 hypothetical protein [Bacteroidota bacterium]
MNIFRLLARIISILAIAFVSLFAMDAFGHGTWWEQLQDFFMHMIPTFILIGILAIAWRWELIGGIIYIVIGLVLAPIIFKHNLAMNHDILKSLWVILIINAPFIAAGTLFVISDYQQKKQLNSIPEHSPNT